MESSSSSNALLEGELRKLEPEWLERFIKRTFFDPCPEHEELRNELNKYCIECDASLCQHCLSLPSHEDHRLLKLYRHVYRDVIPLDEIKRHIDCSQIQAYRCNKQLVIALAPLPSKTISLKEPCQTCKRKLMDFKKNKFCSITCKVKAFIKKPDDDLPPFLSLDLRVQNSKQQAEPEMTALDQLAETAEQEAMVFQLEEKAEQETEDLKTTIDQLEEKPKHETELDNTTGPQVVQNANQAAEPINKRTRKRKGIPHRSPLF